MNIVTSYMQVGATAGVLGGIFKGNGNPKIAAMGLALGAAGGYLLDQTPSIVTAIVLETLRKGALGAGAGAVVGGAIGFNMYNNDRCLDEAGIMGAYFGAIGAVAGGVFGLLS